MTTIERIAIALERIAESVERRNTSEVAVVSPEALSKEDAARFLGVDVPTIEHLIRTRKLPYVQHGSQRGRDIPVEDLRKFILECRQATGTELRKGRSRS